MRSTGNKQMRRLAAKHVPIALAFLAPFLVLIWFSVFPQTDLTASLPLFHFYIVTFTTFSAAVISILLSVALREIARPRHYLTAVAFAVIGAIFFTHGLATPGALIDYLHPAVNWSAWLTLFGGGLIFALAGLDGPEGTPAWLSIRRVTQLVAASVTLYLAIALFAPQLLEWINANAGPWHRWLIFYVTLGLWLLAAFGLGRIWGNTGSRVDGTLAFVAFWLAAATVSMHQFPVWQLSWWLYHFILLVGFLVTVYILLVEYEQAREFRLLRYYLATSLIVTALMALVASYLFAEFSYRVLIVENQVVSPVSQDLNQTVLQARMAGLLITGLSMSVLFGILLLVVARADRIITSRTKELAVAYENLRQAERMRDDLTHMIVHDLRNLLSIIYASLRLARHLYREEQAETHMHYIEQSLRASERMTDLIDEILTVSKIEAGQLKPKIEPTSMAQLLSDRLNGFAAQATEQNKQLTLDCPTDLNASFDVNMIGRVVDNLVSNALKYTRNGGQIQVSAWADNGRLHVRIRDNGEGISDDYKQLVFEKFAQAPHAPKKPQRKGIGLGLAFCGLAVQLHGGRIWVEDAPGGGSDFIFWLPQPQKTPMILTPDG
jgi:signal transduction histidine kinase